MKKIVLPKGFEHGGYNHPTFTGFRRNGPAFLFQFIYKKDLAITVDLTLSVPVSLTESRLYKLFTEVFKRDYLAQWLYKEGLCQEMWLLPTGSGTWMCSNSLSEQTWFKKFEYNLVPKIVLRLCKILVLTYTKVEEKDISLSHRSIRQVEATSYLVKKNSNSFHTASHPLQECTPTIRTYISNYQTIIETTPMSHFRCDDLRFLTLQDQDLSRVTEHVGQLSFFQSYLFKKVILTMMAADKTNGEDTWQSKHNIPDLVLCVLDTLLSLLDETCTQCATMTGPKLLSTVWEVDNEDFPDMSLAVEQGDMLLSHKVDGISEHPSEASKVSEESRNETLDKVDTREENIKCVIPKSSPIPMPRSYMSIKSLSPTIPHIHYKGKLYPCPVAAFLRVLRYGRQRLRDELEKIIDVLHTIKHAKIMDP